MSTRGYATFCDGCGVEAQDRRNGHWVTPALVGWIEGATCTATLGVSQNRFHACSSECLLTYAKKRVGVPA